MMQLTAEDHEVFKQRHGIELNFNFESDEPVKVIVGNDVEDSQENRLMVIEYLAGIRQDLDELTYTN